MNGIKPKDAHRYFQRRNEELTKIASKVLGLKTLKQKMNDSDDFSEHAVWVLREALEQAFLKGYECARHYQE